MEEMHTGKGMGKRCRVPMHIALPASPYVRQLGSSLNPILLGFYGGFIS